jgi:hypothetical protein
MPPGAGYGRPAGISVITDMSSVRFTRWRRAGGQHVQERRGAADGRHTTSSSAVTLGEIEKLGWRLEHAGYFFIMNGETSTARVFVSGEATAISGVTVGVYLFRNTELL